MAEASPQILSGRFSYGPLDMAALTGEKVDIHIMKDPPVGDWVHVATEVTDKHGRLSFSLPSEHIMGYGVFPVRMLVRGDHSMLHMNLCCVPPQTETVVFSIDGSFAGSMSLTGKVIVIRQISNIYCIKFRKSQESSIEYFSFL